MPLFQVYLIPFEITSILLLVAVVIFVLAVLIDLGLVGGSASGRRRARDEP